MSINTKVSGTQKNIVEIYTKVSGVQKMITKGYSKENGVWKEFYSSMSSLPTPDIHYDKSSQTMGQKNFVTLSNHGDYDLSQCEIGYSEWTTDPLLVTNYMSIFPGGFVSLSYIYGIQHSIYVNFFIRKSDGNGGWIYSSSDRVMIFVRDAV